MNTASAYINSKTVLLGATVAAANGVVQTGGSLGIGTGSGNFEIRPGHNVDASTTLTYIGTALRVSEDQSVAYGYAGDAFIASISNVDNKTLFEAGRSGSKSTNTNNRIQIVTTTAGNVNLIVSGSIISHITASSLVSKIVNASEPAFSLITYNSGSAVSNNVFTQYLDGNGYRNGWIGFARGAGSDGGWISFGYDGRAGSGGGTAGGSGYGEKLRVDSTGISLVTGSLRIASGTVSSTNTPVGTGTLSAGSATITNSLITTNSLIFITAQNTPGTGTPGALRVEKSAGSAVVKSTSSTDVSTFAYLIINPS
jgi:hypothetical protein